MRWTSRRLATLGLALYACALPSLAEASGTAFLVVAPDRGFLGNEETRDAFTEFAAGRSAALSFVTDERTRDSLDSALRSLAGSGARDFVVVPFFVSRRDPRYTRLVSLLEQDAGGMKVSWARPFGESYLAAEALADRLRGLDQRARTRVVVVGVGARDDESRAGMLADYRPLAQAAADGLGFESVRVVVEASRESFESSLEEAAGGAEHIAIVPFHLGRKLDGMMSDTALIAGASPPAAHLVPGGVTPDPSVAQWMAREANRWTAVSGAETGVVVLAHGADYHWNETMRRAVEPLARRYLVEPAFSMADPVVIGRAVSRLEARGARLIVVLRVFGLASSFRADVERLIGLDVEREGPAAPAAGHVASPPDLAMGTATARGTAHPRRGVGHRRERHEPIGGHVSEPTIRPR